MDPAITLNSFIISETPMPEADRLALIDNPSRGAYAAAHIFFSSDDYLAPLFGRVLG